MQSYCMTPRSQSKRRQKYTHEHFQRGLVLTEINEFKNLVRLDLIKLQDLLDLVTLYIHSLVKETFPCNSISLIHIITPAADLDFMDCK